MVFPHSHSKYSLSLHRHCEHLFASFPLPYIIINWIWVIMDSGNFSDIFTMQTLHTKKYKSCINIQMNDGKGITNLFPSEMNSKERIFFSKQRGQRFLTMWFSKSKQIYITFCLTCGGRRGSRMKARSTPRSCCLCWTSWHTHIIKAWKMVSSSGTLMSSLESSLTMSAVGSSKNSWFWMTSRKCSWNTDETWLRQIIIGYQPTGMDWCTDYAGLCCYIYEDQITQGQKSDKKKVDKKHQKTIDDEIFFW